MDSKNHRLIIHHRGTRLAVKRIRLVHHLTVRHLHDLVPVRPLRTVVLIPRITNNRRLRIHQLLRIRHIHTKPARLLPDRRIQLDHSPIVAGLAVLLVVPNLFSRSRAVGLLALVFTSRKGPLRLPLGHTMPGSNYGVLRD